MEGTSDQNLQSIAFQTAEGVVYILQVANSVPGETETNVPLQMLIDNVIQKSPYLKQSTLCTVEELQQPPPFNPTCTETPTYCISNEDLHKVIPDRKMGSNLSMVIEPLTITEHAKPSAPPIITELNETSIHSTQRQGEYPKAVVMETVKDCRSNIVPNYSCTETATYCISNEELHKAIPDRKLEKNLSMVIEPLTITEQGNLIASPNAAQQNKTSIQPKKRQRERPKAVVKEIVKEFRSKTCIVPNYFHIPDRAVPPRAIAVLPSILRMHRDVIYPRRNLPSHVRFGPVKGVCTKICHSDAKEIIFESVLNNEPVFFLNHEEHCVTHLDVSDKDKSNWLSLLPLGTQETANLWLYEENQELYAIAVKPLKPRVPLKLGYSKQYATTHNLPNGQPILDLTEAFPNVRQCHQCDKTFAMEHLLIKHMAAVHKNTTRRRYRCSFCSRTFHRLFSLRRHVSRFCTEKKRKICKTNTVVQTEPSPDATLFSQSADESKLPSDESFQNYTNNLDFSTNLFDTDRMPSLDLSGCSKPDDFNPYLLKDDGLMSDVGANLFSNNEQTSVTPLSKSKEKSKEEHVFCPYCNEAMLKSKRRQHIMRECPKRRFYCHCGQIFNRKDLLAKHVHEEHNSVSQTATITVEQVRNENAAEEMPYACDECQCRFKRRGMLVNHLWREHKRRPKGVPLKRRILHYPCGVCPKIYRAAAKRDYHVWKHHPDVEFVRAEPIEAGQRSEEPASCKYCPRQYSTRAKLLQHVRASHPQLASPVQKNKKTKNSEN